MKTTLRIFRTGKLTENEKSARQIAVRVAALFAVGMLFAVGWVYWNARQHDQTARARIERNTENNTALAQCIQQWAQQVTVRNALIGERSSDRLAALDALVRAAATPDSTTFRKALNTYLAASAAQAKTNAEHPIPEAPSLDCKLVPLPGSRPSPTPTVTHQSIRTPAPATRTVVVTQTSVAPGPTRTVAVPGPVRTVPGPATTVTAVRTQPAARITVTKTKVVPGPIITVCIGPLGMPCR